MRVFESGTFKSKDTTNDSFNELKEIQLPVPGRHPLKVDPELCSLEPFIREVE